jgi:4-diphosphocytidyl-2-C-methyl-D-erythritol kinase
MAVIIETAPAKINLALHVRRRRPDGYHEIETLFAFLVDGDLLTVDSDAAPGFTITGPFAGALRGEGDNLILQAATAFAERFGEARVGAIILDKRLPVASGIGGGSADAAAMLRILARNADIPIDDPRLIACAAELGADVPACLLGRTARGTGTGTELVPIDGLAGTPVLLVNPGVAVSTAQVFRAWDGVDRGALAAGDPLAAALAGRNDLEAPARRLAPQIDAVLAHLAAQPGVTMARMSGSGATCFALFETSNARDAAAIATHAAAPDWWQLASCLA